MGTSSKMAGNTNSVIHMGRSQRQGFSLASLGRRYDRCRVSVAMMRRELERLTQLFHGGVQNEHSRLINLACRHEMVAQLAYKAIRDSQDGESSQHLSWAGTAVASTEARDRCIAQLGIDRKAPAEPIDWGVVTSASPPDPFPGPAVAGEVEDVPGAVDGVEE